MGPVQYLVHAAGTSLQRVGAAGRRPQAGGHRHRPPGAGLRAEVRRSGGVRGLGRGRAERRQPAEGARPT